MKQAIKLTAILFALAGGMFAQQTINNSTAQSVIPWRIDTKFPGLCGYGAVITRSDMSVGQNVFMCGFNNDWNLVGGAAGGSGIWGSITGNILNQTDLQTTLATKQGLIGLGTTGQYFRGDLTLATFPTIPTVTGGACTNQVVTSIDGSAIPTCNTVALATMVSGFLPHANIAATTVTAGAYTNANITIAADGSITAAASGSSAVPGGSTTQVQYNNGGAFGGIIGVTTDGTNFTGTVPLLNSNLGTTPAGGYTLTNVTPAGSGTQQVSPPVVWTGQGWKTNTTAASQGVVFRGYLLPIQAAAAPAGQLTFDIAVGGGAVTNVAAISSAGVGSSTQCILCIAQGASLNYGLGSVQSNGLDLIIAGANSLHVHTNAVGLPSSSLFQFSSTSSPNGTGDTVLSRFAAATLQHGAADSSTPVAQNIRFQSVLAGATDTPGQNATIKASAGTGTGAGGSIIFQVAPAAVSTGTGQNTLVTALALDSTSLLTHTVSGLGTTPTGGYTLTNATVAAVNTQQVSPPMVWSGSGWGTTGSAPQNVAFRAYALPIQGTNPTGNLLFQSNINNAGYNTIFGINSTFGGATPAIYFGSQPSTGFSGGVNVLWAITGNTAVAEFNSSNQVLMRAVGVLAFNSGNLGGGAADTMMTRFAAATIQHGAADAAAPVAQTIRMQSVVAGTSNVGGSNATIQGSAGTGLGVGGSIVFQTAPAGSTGTAQNSFVTAMTISPTGVSFIDKTPTTGATQVNVGSEVVSAPITNATNANPIVVTSSNTYANGDTVTITGVTGNTAANGTWVLSSISAFGYTLNGSVGNGVYAGGGVATRTVTSPTTVNLSLVNGATQNTNTGELLTMWNAAKTNRTGMASDGFTLSFTVGGSKIAALVNNGAFSANSYTTNGDISMNRAGAGLWAVGDATNVNDPGTTHYRDLKVRHQLASSGVGAVPTITSGFGTSPTIAGGDDSGRINVGTGGVATTGLVTFGTAYTNAPNCIANDETTTLLVRATATTTTLTLTSASAWTASDTVTFQCKGY